MSKVCVFDHPLIQHKLSVLRDKNTSVKKCKRIAGKKLAIVPILRAGLGMVDGMVSMMPNVKVGHIGLFRDPATLEPVKYYFKMPPDIEERDVIVVDPMLATGGSASAAVTFLKEVGVKHVKLMIHCPRSGRRRRPYLRHQVRKAKKWRCLRTGGSARFILRRHRTIRQEQISRKMPQADCAVLP